MKALRDLKRFILVKCAEGNQAEVRSYLIDNLDHLARAFSVPAETIMTSVESVPEDRALAERLLETILRAETLLRKERKESRARSAQASAAALASMVEWRGEKALVDMPSLLASALTRRQDMLVFACDDFTVSIHMAPLLDLSRITRARTDLTGFVDRNGLHMRWRTGGLTLRPQEDSKAERIFMHLPPCEAVAA